MGSFYVVCAEDSAPASESLAAFEGWLAGSFEDARILERGGSGPNALKWMRGDYGTQIWMDGSLSDDRSAIYLEGDMGLVCETALAVRAQFPPGSAVVFTGDWQGIPFDLGLFADPAVLADAVERGDDTKAWREE